MKNLSLNDNILNDDSNGGNADMTENGSIQSIERFFEIIELLSKNGSMGVTEIAKATSLNKTTVFRMLSTAGNLGYVCKDDNNEKYKLTLKILSISARILDSIDVRSIVRHELENLAKDCTETVHFVQREGNNIVYIDKVESLQNSVRMVSRIGMRHEMYCTGVGKAILAEMSNDEIKNIWDSSQIERKTEKTIVNFNKFMEELENVRKFGYAVDNEENELGVRCVAASCFDYSGKAKYAFSVSAPVSRMDDQRVEKIAPVVIKTKSDICLALGYSKRD